ncbi:MAG: phosphonoacetaldehyde reductase [Reyranella sp.]|uniref:iron-containing alcohol dehydrogenase PsrA n=1 Tax=Reyranella sp. TaxID=1929291 RepID=UPI001AD43349|nr:iron-containing alcohol dehydrogenase PsrA [Reyranella sp.]MBN9085827.1 phosphonoacetaldehyde reductase [Reyranella sp.]
MWRYRNPVEVQFGAGAFDRLSDALNGRAYCLVTYDDANGGGIFAELTRRVAALAGDPAAMVRNIGPNPDYIGLTESCRLYAQATRPVEAIVALGGGSVIDAAKVLAAASDGNGSDFGKVRTYLETGTGADTLGATPIVAIPTTAGTGSEVTSWATVWDTTAKKKYSLSRPSLYPEAALVDPLLTLGLPRGITVSTGLDALSHALESIWNVNANPVSNALAEVAAREVLDALPALAADLGNAGLRTRLSRASLFAGLAFSNTKTALAHALSYHLTLHHGVPHGIACSFSLSLVMRSVIGCNADCDAALRRIFGPDLAAGAARLEATLQQLGVSPRATDHGIAARDWSALVDGALAGERGRNFIGRREVLIGQLAA